MREKHDTVIIGGGQAGLAMSYHLSQRRREHLVLERRRIAERWRTERWDSLRFQLPNWALDLPGKAYDGPDPEGFSHHEDVLRFVLDYAQEIGAPVRTGIDVTRLSQGEDDLYSLDTSDGPIEARHVVIATGPFQHALIPNFSRAIPGSVLQIDAAHYRSPEQLPKGAVLVVGSGNSGCQIADEVFRSGRRVLLAISRHVRVPRRYRGKDLIWWYENLGRFDVNIETFPDRRYPPTTIMTGIGGGYDLAPRHLGSTGVTLQAACVGRLTARWSLPAMRRRYWQLPTAAMTASSSWRKPWPQHRSCARLLSMRSLQPHCRQSRFMALDDLTCARKISARSSGRAGTVLASTGSTSRSLTPTVFRCSDVA